MPENKYWNPFEWQTCPACACPMDVKREISTNEEGEHASVVMIEYICTACGRPWLTPKDYKERDLYDERKRAKESRDVGREDKKPADPVPNTIKLFDSGPHNVG
jgi:hypothetical protein